MDFSYEVIELVPRRIFRTARTASATSESVIVRVSDGEYAGIGEAAPSRFYGEDTETVLALFQRLRPVVERCRHESELMAELTSRGGRNDPAARAALEIAAHDMMGRRYGLPLCRYFDLDPLKTPRAIMSVGLDDPDVMVEKALEVRWAPLIKVKLDRDTDPGVVARIKEATGASVTVDANCAWEVGEARTKIGELERIGVELVEQPVAADDVEGLRTLTVESGVPIYADESCPTLEDIPRVAGSVSGIVIKLMKCGGVIEAVRMAREARARGLGTMIGCMLESSLALTAAAHISPLMDSADLDSGHLLKEDPYVGMRFEEGRIVLPDGAGLGVRPAAGAA